MATNTNQEIANKAFANNKDLKKVFVADGYPFATENAANLHKNTSNKKGIQVFSFSRVEDTTKPTETKAVVKLAKLNKANLLKVAESNGIRPEENATKAQIIEQIEAVDKTKNKQ